MKILINGNLGYVGPVLVRHLRKALPKTEIVGFDSGFFADSLIRPEVPPAETPDTQLVGDVRKLPPELFEGVDAVVQLAAISNDPMGNAFEKVTGDINALATLETAKRAKAAGVRSFVFASSCSVYGAGGSEAKSESSEVGPLTAYARSKLAAEEALKSLASKDFKITCLRFATACGFSPRMRFDLVLNDFVASALSTGRIDILSDGTPWRPLIHLTDMARAIEWAIVRPLTTGKFLVVNAGSDEWNYRISELAEAVQKELGNVTVSITSNAVPDKRSYRVDFGLFRTLAPNHQPQETLSGAVSDLAENLKELTFADPSFRSSKYIRLKTLSDLRKSDKLSEDLFWN